MAFRVGLGVRHNLVFLSKQQHRNQMIFDEFRNEFILFVHKHNSKSDRNIIKQLEPDQSLRVL